MSGQQESKVGPLPLESNKELRGLETKGSQVLPINSAVLSLVG